MAISSLISVAPPVTPPTFSPILPGGERVIFDATDAASITLGGLPAADGSLIDAWNIATAAAESEPFYDTRGCGSGPAIVFGRRGRPIDTTTTFLTSGSISLQIPFIAVCVCRVDLNQHGFSQTQAQMCLVEWSADVTASAGFQLSANNAWGARVRGSSGLQNVDSQNAPFWIGENLVQYVTLENDGTLTKLSINGVLQKISASGVAPGAGAITSGGTLGCNHASAQPLNGAIGLFGIWDSLTATERGQLDAFIRANWRLTVPNQKQIYAEFAIGDSIAGGANLQFIGSTFPNSIWAFNGRQSISMGHRFGLPYNIAVSGARLVGGPNLPDIATQATTIAGVQIPGRRNFIHFEGGVNSIGTDTAANIFSQFQTIATGIVANWNGLSGGPHVLIVYTISFSIGFTGPQNADRLSVNASIRAAFAGWATSNVHVVLADIGGDTILGTSAGNVPGNFNFFENDGLHPAKTGQERWASFASDQIAALGL